MTRVSELRAFFASFFFDLANPFDLVHKQLLVLCCVVLLLGEVRLGRLELADDLVALLGGSLAHLEDFRDLAGPHAAVDVVRGGGACRRSG